MSYPCHIYIPETIEDLETIEDIEAFCHRPNCSDNHDAIKDLETIEDFKTLKILTLLKTWRHV